MSLLEEEGRKKGVFDLLRNNEISPFAIPQHYGFERRICECSYVNGKSSSVCYYQIDGAELRTAEDVYKYILETKLEIPISMFSFEPTLRTTIINKPDQLKMNVLKVDISEGQELVPISVTCPVTMIDSTEPLAIYCSQYIKDEALKTSLDHDDEFLTCCDCSDNCQDKLNCACFMKTLDNCSEKTRKSNGALNIGYNYKRLEQPFLSGIFECNRRCKCKNTCFNRVAQNGIYCKLQIFKTVNKGWGVRALHDIPKGTFVSNYVGKIVSGNYADKASKDLNEGKWKYLTLLSVGEEDKEGYESDVVEPEEPPEVASTIDDEDIESNSQVTPSAEAEPLQQHDECEEISINDPNVSSSVDCCASQSHESVCFEDEMETCDSNLDTSSELDTKSSNSIENAPDSQTADLQAPLYHERSTTSSFHLLRSSEIEDLSFVDSLSPLKGKRFGEYSSIPMEDLNAILRWNEMMKRRSLCVLGRGKPRVGKVTRVQLVKAAPPLPDLPQNRDDRMRSSSRIARSLAEKIVRAIKLDPFTVSSSSSSLPLFKRKIFKIKRNRMNMKDLSKIPVRRIMKKKSIWQRPRCLYKRVIKTKKPINPFLIKSYQRRRRRLMSKKEVTSPVGSNKSKALHKLLRFELNVDGMDTGNVGRYFNHSCDPNLFPQYVFIDNHDLRLPQISLFASRNIQAGEELTWNYNYSAVECDEEEQQEQNAGSSPMMNKCLTRMYCYCGADNCTNRLC